MYAIIQFNDHCFLSKISTCASGQVNWKSACLRAKFTWTTGWVLTDFCSSNNYVYRPQTKLQKGNVSTPVCQSFCSQGVSASVHAGKHTPSRQTPPHPVHAGIHTPLPSACWDTAPPPLVHAGIDMATAAYGTHPTGMHSCYMFFYPFLARLPCHILDISMCCVLIS